MDTQIQQTFEQLKQTISVSTSPFHTAKEAMRRLNEAGFVTLDWDSTWELVPGGKYTVCPFAQRFSAFKSAQTFPIPRYGSFPLHILTIRDFVSNTIRSFPLKTAAA